MEVAPDVFSVPGGHWRGLPPRSPDPIEPEDRRFRLVGAFGLSRDGVSLQENLKGAWVVEGPLRPKGAP